VLDTRRTLPALAVRAGVHTGPVVVGDLGTGERGRKQALGTAMNIAARLQGIAPPGTVVMSDATERLVAGMFLTRDLGAPPLKGIEEPIRACVVLESTGVRSRLDTDPSYVAPLIGRERELTELRGYWQQARSGSGQVALISGEAGLGKSRLVRRFMGQVADAGDGRAFEWRCSPFHTSTPFHPIVESLEHYLGIERGAPREHIGPRIQKFLSTVWMPSAEESAVVEASNLIGEMVSGGTSAVETSSETALVRRSRTLNLLCDLVRAQASSHPPPVSIAYEGMTFPAPVGGAFEGFSSADVNDAGQVVFYAKSTAGGCGLFLGDGTSLTMLAWDAALRTSMSQVARHK